MMTNKMKDVAKVLGVELNEEFRIEGFKEDYKITEKGMQFKTTDGGWITDNDTFVSIIYDNSQIIKKPWKPQEGDCYYSVIGLPSGGGWHISEFPWKGMMQNYESFFTGNCFRTKEEAEAHRTEIYEKLKANYDEA